ncbi:MAG: PAC2 family protein [Chloroflexi bacterium]|nr:PAC2 family protein [Chloroflexota bacterium]
MEYVTYSERPALKESRLVCAFAGWPDAQEGATMAVRYLVRKLSAKKFAEIDPEEFYDFYRQRPVSLVDDQGRRSVRWPANEFYYTQGQGSDGDLVFFVGIEPHLKWKTFASAFVEVAGACAVNLVALLGSLQDAVPHTRDARVSGSANQPELRKTLEGLGMRGSGYQGPTGAPTAVLEACSRQGISYCSIWGHASHYIQVSPNPKVSLALLSRLAQVLGIQTDLDDLRAAGSSFEAEVNKAIAGNVEIAAYLRKLEQRYDQEMRTAEELPSSEVIVQDLEDFLRRQQRGDVGEGPRG